MIKKIKTLIYTLIITGIFLITGTNTTNGAGAYTTIGINKYDSALNSQFKLGFLKGGGLLTEYLGQGKSILAMDNNVLFRRTPDGQPYFYSPNMQGFFSHYAVCDYMANTNSGLQNCSITPLTGDYKAMLKGFFSKIKQGDIAYYNYQYDQGGVNCGYHHYYITVCRSSEEIGNTLCFNYQDCYNGCSLNQCDMYCRNGLCGGGLINSQNYQNLSRGMVANSQIGKAPGQNGYDGTRDNEENNTNNNTTNIGSCPTIRQIMQSMGENYNTGLCYNNTTYFNGTTFEQIEKEDIFTIFNDYQEYTNRISIYRNNCTKANTTQACQNAFSGEYKKYSIISNATNSNVDEKKLRNYCNFGLNYDPNATTCVASGGGIKEPYTNKEIIEEIVNDGEIPTPGINETGSNNVLNALNKCEDGDRNCYVNNRNFIDSLKNIYGKITGLFKERNGVNGIIPSYILRIAFLTILFTVIFKK